jgi:Holliday junction resolvase RusA-like endonuclease
MSLYQLEIPDWSPSSVNRLMRRVKERIRRKQADRLIVACHVSQSDIPKATGPRRVSVTVTAPGRLPDPDNVLKSLLDCLVCSRLLVDDSREWLELGTIRVERGSPRKTVIMLEEVVNAAT